MQSLDLELSVKLLSLVGAAVAFCWGVFQFSLNQRNQSQTRRIEATRPFLDRQLTLYTEATQSVATLATCTRDEEVQPAAKRFWLLYWGELALVEDTRVEAAMVKFGRAIEQVRTPDEMRQLSLGLAHACRDSLAESWGVKHWRSPHNSGE